MDTLAILDRLDHVRPTARGGTARCPAHEDRENSLSVSAGDDGRVLLRCFGGCRTEDVVAAMGLTLADLFTDNGHRPAGRARTTRRVVPYEVRDRAGELRAVHERRDGGDGTKSFVWRRPDGASGLNGTAAADLPLYAIERLPAEASTVVLVEGEKAADSLIARGVPAVASVTGAATAPSAETLRDLAGRHVVLWPDADEPGQAHMAAIGERLHDVAASVRLATWPDAPLGGDAADYDGDPWDVVDAAESAPPPPGPTWRTLADISDAPTGPLALGMLEDGPNLLYALGGTGKGTTGAWMCGEALAAGLRPMVYDAENRPREWARRVSGLGIDRAEVVYVQPSDLPRALLGRPLWEVAPHLGLVAGAAGVGLLFVDSVLPAVGVGEERLRSDAQAPYLYVASLDELGIPSVSFGHPPKGQPEGDPFGSVSWVNAMRLTWLGTRGDGDGHRIRWRPRKRNERGYVPGVLLTVEYGADGRPCRVVREDDEASTRTWLLGVLDTEPRSTSDLADELLDQTLERESAPSKDEAERAQARIRQALLRMSHEGLVAKDGKGRSTKWFRPDPSRLQLAVPWSAVSA